MKPFPFKDIEPSITDHAVLRWLERVYEIDVEQIRAMIRDEVRPYVKAGASKARIGNLEYRFEGPSLVTIIARRA